MTTFTIILSLLSGVALFLFGMSLMGDGLKKVAGNKLEVILYQLRKLRNDESCAGDRNHHGSQYRNKCNRLDFVFIVH